MPNGHRDSYRLGDGPPSPVHTSDSEDTFNNKLRWVVLCRWVVLRWRHLIQRRRRAARVDEGLEVLMACRLRGCFRALPGQLLRLCADFAIK